MSLGACIPDMLKRGEIDPTRAARMKELFEELELHYRASMGPDAAAAEASEATLRQLAIDARLKKRQTLLQANRQVAAMKDLGRHRDGVSYGAVRAMLDDDAAGAPYANVTRSTQIIEFDIHRRVSGFIETHRRSLLGKTKNVDDLWDTVRAMTGETVDNPRASLFADAIRDTNEYLRQRFNAAGGAIGKLDNYFPHQWSSLKVREKTADDFLAIMEPELDRARMIDNRTGVVFTDKAMREALLDVRETIRTNGLTGEATSAFKGGGRLANSRSDHRFLHFKDADSWRRVNDAFGAESNPFNAIMGHFTSMAHDIAQMERFGPNPDATMRLLLDHVAKTNAKAEGGYSADVAGRSGGRLLTEQLWKYVKGEGRSPIVPDSWVQGPPVAVSAGFDVVRNTLTAAMLGSSPLSALTDFGTQLTARKFNGLSQVSVLKEYLKQLNPASATDRQLAIRLGLGMRDASHSMLGIHRYLGTAQGPGWSQIAPDAVLRVSGLNKLTEAGQRAFGVNFLGELGSMRDLEWGKLPDANRAAMDRYGIGKWEWTAIRQSEPVTVEGAHFLDASAISNRDAADKLMTMVLAETNRAVQESSAIVKASITGNQRPGTWGGLATANSTQFMGFGIGLVVDQARRMSTMPKLTAATYGMAFAARMTVIGAMVIQLREFVKGHDPRPMDNFDFWSDSMLQGGAFGILGDVIGSFQNGRLAHNFLLAGGPTGSFVGDIYDGIGTALPGKVRKDGTRRAGNPGAAAVRLARRYTPGTNLWFSRLIVDQMLWDELDAMANPEHDKKIERDKKTLEKNKQGAWWGPGDTLPNRAPDLTNALGPESAP